MKAIRKLDETQLSDVSYNNNVESCICFQINSHLTILGNVTCFALRVTQEVSAPLSGVPSLGGGGVSPKSLEKWRMDSSMMVSMYEWYMRRGERENGHKAILSSQL
ncbi:hypothetical protein AVEN_265296-1 [Araneus ventricosus]|uniref:Uncharacterized protein n=1 Tax=Araneus ventricosus TaxID=182803 RepID=A0A4Y2EM49_ARAVE|nr:hypothetical protein AVEN_265296-1 [Araneus ventricosus]